MKAGLVGPSYQQFSLPFDAQRTINLFPIMDQFGKEPASLYGTPGNAVFATAPFGVGRGVYKASNDRGFAVIGTNVCEVFANGNYEVRGTLPDAVGYVTFADNGFQLAVCDGLRLFMLTFSDNAWKQVVGGREYCENGDFASAAGWTTGAGWSIGSGVATASTSNAALSRTAAFPLVAGQTYTLTYTITRTAGTITPSIGGTNGVARAAAGTYIETITTTAANQTIAFTGTGFSGTVDNISIRDVSNGFVSASSVTFIDGYFVVSRAPNTGIFQISGLYNGFSWAALDFATAESSPDNLLRVINVSGQLWLCGTETTEIWANTGSLGFPFQRVSGAKIEQGVLSAYASISLDNSLFWVGRNREGFGIVYRADGFSPQRISTDAIELKLQEAPEPSTLKMCAYQEMGHYFLMITGGGMGTAFVYDLATQLWHERAYLNEYGVLEQPLVNDVMYVFEKHIGCNRTPNGRLYHQSMRYYDDDGDEICRERTFTHIFEENQRMSFKNLTVGFETGVGNVVNPGQNPQCVLYLSNDGGKTWSGGYMKSLGAMGRYLDRVTFFRLGRARQRTFKVRVTSPVKVCITGAYFNV